MKPPTANSLKRSREPRARQRDAPASHYRSSPRWRPPPERGSSGHEGLRWWVEETLSSVAGALRTTRLYVPNFAPRGGSGHHPGRRNSTARNPRWPAPVRNAETAVGYACEGRSPRGRAGTSKPEPHAGRRLATYASLLNGFAFSLTLFSKCFSPFPHGTCLLSVSCLILALGGVYHPLWAAFPNNLTLQRHLISWQAVGRRTGFSPSLTRHSRSTLVGPPTERRCLSRLQFAGCAPEI